MFVLFYILSLGVSAGIVVLFGRHVLVAEGAVSSFSGSLIVATGLVSLYVGLQLLYMAFIQLLYPTRDKGPLFTEMLSHGCVLVLIVAMTGVRIPWPHALLFQFESFIWLGLFVGLHIFFKLLTLFSATQSRPTQGLSAYLWLAAGLLCMLGGFWSYSTWEDPHSKANYGEELWTQFERLTAKPQS